MPDGHLSPAAFSPVSRAAAAAAAQPASAAALLPGAHNGTVLHLVFEQAMPEGASPDSGCLGTAADGTPLLLLHSRAAQRASVLRLPLPGAPGARVEVAFAAEAMAAAAVTATRSPSAAAAWAPPGSLQPDCPALPPRDFLLLQPSGRLVLQVGAVPLCGVTLQPAAAAAAAAADPIARLAQWGDEGLLAGPAEGSDCAMSTDDGDEDMVSPGGSGPNVAALGAALEAAPEPAGLQDAVGCRVTVSLRGGGALRCALPFAPMRPLPAAALDALAEALPPPAWQAFHSRYLVSPGAASGDAQREWAAFAGVLAAWAAAPRTAPKLAPLLRRPSAVSSSGDPEPGRAPTPGGSVDSAPGAAWEALLHSPHHRAVVAARRFPWLADSSAGQALTALHSVYEDAKLHTLRWHLLPRLGAALVPLARLAGAPDYADQYLRDLGPAGEAGSCGTATPTQQLGQAPVRPPPANVHRALEALLAGRAVSEWVPALAAARSSAVARTVDLLDLYSVLSATAGQCAELLAGLPGDADGIEGTAVPPAQVEALQYMRKALLEGSHALILAMVDKGWRLAELESLPVGVALPLREALYRCRADPPPGWPTEAYALVGRTDMATAAAAAAAAAVAPVTPTAVAAAVLPSLGTPAGAGVRAPASDVPMRQPQLRTPIAGGGLPPRSRLSIGGGADAAPRLLGPGLCWGEAVGEAEGGVGLRGEPQADGIEGLTDGAAKLRFGRDLRLVEVRALLGSATPAALRVAAAPEAGDPELAAAQQARLMALATRTMALPLGRGALTLGTLRPLPTEPLPVPALCLAGRLPEQHNAIVNLDLTAAQPAPGGGAAADTTAWPEFHNGAAAGLRLVPGGAALTRAWFVYNKPKGPSYTHGGMLMGLGLTGHLACLSSTDLYRYLSQEHDATTIGVLLGMAAAKRATLDATISKMLFLHIPTRHPATYPELELSPLVQAAALLGVGLLYQGSCHRLTTEIMIEEIGRRPGGDGSGGGSGDGGDGGAQRNNADAAGASGAVAQDREGYALAAGLALGLITLGRGHDAAGLADMHIVDRLRHFMVGGNSPCAGGRASQAGAAGAGPQPAGGNCLFGPGVIGSDPTLGFDAGFDAPAAGGSLPGARSEEGGRYGAQGVSQVVLEGALVNLDVTSPGATLALGLMFLKTGDAAVAAAFAVPDTRFALDYVRPDLVQLRVAARALVLWADVAPSEAWVQAQLPTLIQGPVDKFVGPSAEAAEDEDAKAIAQAHINAVAGACLAVGIKYAGSANAAACGLLTHYCAYFQRAKHAAPDSMSGNAGAWGRLDKAALEACLCTVALALATVMAGSGHLPTLRLLRGLRKRLCPVAPASSVSGGAAANYSSHAAIAMALGFLFLGGGGHTFATDNASVAALVVALFPRFPMSPTDQRCHLQAFRHLYVLAAEPRCVDAVDVDSRKSTYVPLHIHLDAPAAPAAAKREAGGACVARTAPCLLPERSQVREVEVAGPRFWRQRVPAGSTLAALYRSGALYVQRRAGAPAAAAGLPVDERAGPDALDVHNLLPHAPSQAAGLGETDGSVDLARLCATFGADPFITALAQSPAELAGAAPGGTAGGHDVPEHPAAQAAEADDDFQSFCRSVLYECITQEKPAALGSCLFLHTAVAALLGHGRATQGGWGLRALAGGLPPTVPLWSLRLALALQDSAPAFAASALARAALASGDWDGAASWAPLLQPVFLEGLWRRGCRTKRE
ncbi:hypothetical protein WJX81_007920 [Elliptochloris bilobata]|uniref:Anaphase-promoting complex subunit 1 n=1 Tax=Elliptochloris bilobata TaxID=381761 RepID=A0AAW1QCE7_9CHLO